MTSPLEVAIGVCVTYLGFDRFRYHQRAKKLIDKFGKQVATPSAMLAAMKKDGLQTHERDFLACLYHCGGPELAELIEPDKKEVFDGEIMKTMHGALMSFVLKHTADRKAVQGLLVALCLVQLAVAWVLYTQDAPPEWMGAQWVGNTIFGLVLAAFLVPAVAFGLSERMLGELRKASDRWVRDEVVKGKRNAKDADIAGITDK